MQYNYKVQEMYFTTFFAIFCVRYIICNRWRIKEQKIFTVTLP